MKQYPDFKSMLESIICPIYKQHPKIIINDDNSIEMECCCDEFKEQCMHLLSKFLGERTIQEAVIEWRKNNPVAN